MITEIISVGTEVLMGNILNTNAQNLATICNDNGHYVHYHSVVGDNYNRAKNIIKIALDRVDLVIVCGGLGPTDDDITLQVVADVVNKKLIYDLDIEKDLKEYINNSDIPNNIFKQAYKVDGSIILPNNHGSAHGNFIKLENGKIIVVIPGPPNECLPMFNRYAIPLLSEYAESPVVSKIVKLHNIGEARATEMIENIIRNQTDPTIAPYCKFMEVQFRISSSDNNPEIAKNKIDSIVKKLNDIFEENIYSTDEKFLLEDEIFRLLHKNSLTISIAESCTGGMLASRLINVSGISEHLKSTFVTYSNETKINILGVSDITIKNHTAVSIETVKEMLDGLYKITKDDIQIAISGVAGPGQDADGNPQGLTIIGIKINNEYDIISYKFDGDRYQNRVMSTTTALIQLRNKLLNLKNNYLSIYGTNKE